MSTIFKFAIAIIVIIALLVFIGSVLINTLSNISGFLPGGTSRSGTAGLWMSSDGGISWAMTGVLENKKKFSSVDVLDFVVHPADKTIFYAASNGKGLYRSTDAGENWTSVTDSNGILNSKTVVYKILISNKDPNIIYAAIYQNNRGYIVKSADGGDSFFEIYVAPKIKEKIYAINMDAYNPLLLYMITDQGLFLKSFDGGNSWNFIEKLNNGAREIIISPKDDIYVLSLNGSLIKSQNQGIAWENINVRGGDVGALVNSKNPAFLPKNTVSLSSGAKVLFLKINVNFNNILYAGVGNKIYRSYDGGKTWGQLNLIVKTENVSVSSFAQDKNDPRVMYVGVSGSQIYKSLDDGNSWSVHNIQNTGKAPSFIFIGEGKEIFAVFNNGQ